MAVHLFPSSLKLHLQQTYNDWNPHLILSFVIILEQVGFFSFNLKSWRLDVRHKVSTWNRLLQYIAGRNLVKFQPRQTIESEKSWTSPYFTCAASQLRPSYRTILILLPGFPILFSWLQVSTGNAGTFPFFHLTLSNPTSGWNKIVHAIWTFC